MSPGLAQRLVGRGCTLMLDRPRIMAVLNTTPDSFSDGGRYLQREAAIARGLQLCDEGADLLDIGGESTRPGAAAVGLDEELSRVIPVIEGLRERTDRPISVDTNKAAVAKAAVTAGANFINDISGLTFDPEMAAVAAESGAGVFLMHTRGRPEVMQQDTAYADLLGDVLASLQRSIDLALAAGVERCRLAVDPGIGFGKSVLGNLRLLHHLDHLHRLGCPVLLGTSRKNFLGQITGQQEPTARLAATLATLAVAVQQGVQLFRVHDVRPALDAVQVAWAIREQRLPTEESAS